MAKIAKKLYNKLMDKKSSSKIDVIVVGAGPSGIASAITIARGGKKVVVLERADFYGSKNMFGGAIYLSSIKALFPNNWQNAPYESNLVQSSYSFLTKNSSVEIKHKTDEKTNTISVFRPKFDSWLVEEAKKEGVYFAPKTVVRSLIIENKKVIGVKTDIEEIYAPIVIIAEGSQSNLALQAGLKKELQAKNFILGVKETLKLDKEKIQERFNVKEGDGCMMELFGGLAEGDEQAPLALGFLYTFKNHISIGLGANLEDLANLKLKPYELLEKLKAHPSVAPFIEGGEVVEYSTHTIPGGLKDLAKPYMAGALVVGDSCGFINSVHFEGTNLAIYSGIFAGETALVALNKGDFSEKTLSLYKNKLNKSFIMKDLKTYKNIMNMARNRANSIFKFYPEKMSEFFTAFTAADEIPKKNKYQNFIFHFFSDRKFSELLKDIFQFAKSAFEVIKW